MARRGINPIFARFRSGGRKRRAESSLNRASRIPDHNGLECRFCKTGCVLGLDKDAWDKQESCCSKEQQDQDEWQESSSTHEAKDLLSARELVLVDTRALDAHFGDIVGPVVSTWSHVDLALPGVFPVNGLA